MAVSFLRALMIADGDDFAGGDDFARRDDWLVYVDAKVSGVVVVCCCDLRCELRFGGSWEFHDRRACFRFLSRPCPL